MVSVLALLPITLAAPHGEVNHPETPINAPVQFWFGRVGSVTVMV